jgi:hypothetical protein
MRGNKILIRFTNPIKTKSRGNKKTKMRTEKNVEMMKTSRRPGAFMK